MPHPEAMPGDIEPLRALAAARDGVISRDEALRAGFTYYAIRNRIDRGVWGRVGRALFIRDLFRQGDTATAWILHVHAGPLSSVTGPLALRLLGWTVAGEDHLITNPNDVQASIELRVKILRRSVAQHVHLPGLPPLVPRLEALADTLVSRSAPAARNLLDHALQQRWIGPNDLRTVLVARGGPGPRGQKRLREMCDRAASGSRSEAEQRMAALLKRVGGTWVPNHTIHDEQGQVLAEIDFAHLELKIAIEVDGRAFHSDRCSFERDRERQNMLVLRGWVVLRFTWDRLVNDPEGVIAEVLAAGARVRAHMRGAST
jgi:very-short-patch-repair endonuclease